jgi:biopolymer transport protein TolR
VIIRKDEGIDVRINEQTMTVPLPDLASLVKQAQSGKPAGSSAVVIAADRSVKYEVVVKVMDTLQRAGVQRVGLSVQVAK